MELWVSKCSRRHQERVDHRSCVYHDKILDNDKNKNIEYTSLQKIYSFSKSPSKGVIFAMVETEKGFEKLPKHNSDIFAQEVIYSLELHFG